MVGEAERAEVEQGGRRRFVEVDRRVDRADQEGRRVDDLRQVERRDQRVLVVDQLDRVDPAADVDVHAADIGRAFVVADDVFEEVRALLADEQLVEVVAGPAEVIFERIADPGDHRAAVERVAVAVVHEHDAGVGLDADQAPDLVRVRVGVVEQDVDGGGRVGAQAAQVVLGDRGGVGVGAAAAGQLAGVAADLLGVAARPALVTHRSQAHGEVLVAEIVEAHAVGMRDHEGGGADVVLADARGAELHARVVAAEAGHVGAVAQILDPVLGELAVGDVVAGDGEAADLVLVGHVEEQAAQVADLGAVVGDRHVDLDRAVGQLED